MPAKIIDFTAPHKRKTESEVRISEVEKMALDKKMSYGQYVAMLEEEKKKGYDTRKQNNMVRHGVAPIMRAKATCGSATLPALTIGIQQ